MKELRQRSRFAQYLRRRLAGGSTDSTDILAMEALRPLSSRYVPWTPTSMRPSAIVAVLNDVILNDRSRIVECGGGTSTFYIARLLRQRGRGRLVTIEQDEAWVRTLGEGLAAEDLGRYASVVFAPLVESPLSVDGSPWYAEDALSEVTAQGEIELLVVDGPTAYTESLARSRYPAVPFFRPHLAGGATIVLDDIRRRGEQEVLERWERELGMRFERRFAAGGIAIGRAGPARPAT
jgi:predicted O-methyltransferase YrrM